MTIAAILKHKGHDIVSVEPGRTVSEIASLLGEKRIGAVLVMGPGHELLGIISERDIVKGLAKFGAATLDLTVDQLMTRELKTATPHTSVPEAMEMMTTGRFRHLPVHRSRRSGRTDQHRRRREDAHHAAGARSG